MVLSPIPIATSTPIKQEAESPLSSIYDSPEPMELDVSSGGEAPDSPTTTSKSTVPVPVTPSRPKTRSECRIERFRKLLFSDEEEEEEEDELETQRF